MKATKLIHILIQFVEEFGDQEVLIADWSEEWCNPIPCERITYKHDEKCFDHTLTFKEGFILDSK